jgi:molybdenum cofactor cytidylyltransferase
MTEKPSTQLSTDPVKKSPAAIILAAGRGSRMGLVKALLPWWNGETLLEAWIRRFKEAGSTEILVVVGHQAEAVQRSIPKGLEVTWVNNEQAAETGARESLILALDRLESGSSAWFTPVDVPVVDASTLTALAEAFDSLPDSRPLAALPRHSDKTGHPALVGPEFLERLVQGETGDRIDAVFSWATKRLVFADVWDPKVLGNMNFLEDYRAFAPILSGPEKDS